MEERLEQLHRRLNQACRYLLMRAQERFARLSAPAAFARMRNALARRQQRVDELQYQLDAAWHRQSRQMTERLQKLEGQAAASGCKPPHAYGARAAGDAGWTDRPRATGTAAAMRRPGTQVRRGCLQTLSPLAVLNRGYALVFDEAGVLIRDAVGCSRRRPDHHTIRAKHADQPGARKEVVPKQLMRKLFGTDGIRAVAGEAPLDAPTIFATGLALASTLKQSLSRRLGCCWGRIPANPAPGSRR